LDSGSNYNVFIGHEVAEETLADALQNVAIGHRALRQLTSGTHNVAIGSGAMTTSTASTANVAIGASAGNQAGSGATYNVMIGESAGQHIAGSDYNTIVGAQGVSGGGGSSSLSGTQNSTFGYRAGYDLQGAAAYNTLVGCSVGDNVTTGTNNTFLGYHISASGATVTHEIVIGSGVDSSNDFDGAGTETCRIGRASDYITNDFGENATWTHSSDLRIKKDIKDSDLGLAFINHLRPVTYKKKAPSEYPKEFSQYDATQTERNNPDKVLYGFIAQEVKEAMDKVGCSDFTVWSEGKDGMQELGETELITPLIKAVQELSAKVEALESAN
jgi:hypothetical protein